MVLVVFIALWNTTGNDKTNDEVPWSIFTVCRIVPVPHVVANKALKAQNIDTSQSFTVSIMLKVKHMNVSSFNSIRVSLQRLFSYQTMCVHVYNLELYNLTYSTRYLL